MATTEALTVQQSAGDETVERLKQSIRSGRWKEGDRLPPERTLALELDVSRNTIREALGALALMRMVEIRPGSGTYVTSLRPELILDSLSMAVEMSSVATMMDLLALRRIVEAETSSLAAVRITAVQLAGLEACLQEMAAGASAGSAAGESSAESMARLDLRFHALINEASGNSALTALAASLNSSTLRVRIWRFYVEAGVESHAQSEHESIFAAIRDRDPARAAACAGAHVAGVERFLHNSAEHIAG